MQKQLNKVALVFSKLFSWKTNSLSSTNDIVETGIGMLRLLILFSQI